ncbi:hypothetical protein [Patiriisocius hiemis]|uniref:Protoheme IX farnesyltransferase n=1 Tax=Patiriisocius hiemis TaxID=3075604 RepID=A0ABU2Y8Q7_9FLAO|nr:hypothetical protein [Constantimarinum sp. W242]MDT0554559.1 hypothetical protein [Constantimarinum sp. W242]
MKTQAQQLERERTITPKRNTLLAMYIAFVSALVVTYSLVTAVTYL